MSHLAHFRICLIHPEIYLYFFSVCTCMNNNIIALASHGLNTFNQVITLTSFLFLCLSYHLFLRSPQVRMS